MYAQYVGNLLPSQFALLTQIHGQAPHLVLSFSRELSGIDLFHASLYREFDCRVNNLVFRQLNVGW
ncbi:hypothetical protein [Azotobacter beijerinckii]|uniref:hypothetical protein n=1 Tax=Azotobacter beijerinckii TaxID=170623 RepID=UPI0011315CBC|nr:hypothetical protein [Azotobacter beijerinckii]